MIVARSIDVNAVWWVRVAWGNDLCLSDGWEVRGDHAEGGTGLFAEVEFARLICDVCDLSCLVDPTTLVYSGEPEDGSTKNPDASAVGRPHLYCNGNEVCVADAQALDNTDSGDTALASGVSYRG